MGACCCSCSCSSRTATMIVAVLSTLHFMMETAAIVLVGGDHRLVVSPDTSHFYGIAGSQIAMIVFSVILFAGAYVRIMWLCLPWLILTTLNILYHIYIVIMIAMKTISDFDATKLETMILLTFSGMVLTYMAWVVVFFMKDIHRGGSGDRQIEEDTFPLIK